MSTELALSIMIIIIIMVVKLHNKCSIINSITSMVPHILMKLYINANINMLMLFIFLNIFFFILV